jgi:C-terminal processing protease CtpA/Prc
MLGLAVDNSESGAGVVVESVSPRGPANRSDIRVGDIISDINGVPITVVADLLNFMSQVEPGSSVILTVERMGFKGDITVETMPMHMARIPYGMDDSEFLLPDRGRSNNDHDRDDDRRRDRDDDARQSNYRSAWNAMHHYELIEVDESLEPYFGVSEGLLLLFSNDGWRNESQGRSLQLHQGDVIVSIEGSSVQDRRTFIRDFINEIREDNLVSLGIVRRGEPMQLLLDLN